MEEQQREMERREAEKREEYRQRIVERVCQRLRHALVSSALLTWQGNAHTRARMRELGAKVAALLRGMFVGAVLRRWRAASVLTRKRRPGLLRPLGGSRALTLSSALGCWRSVTSECLALRRKEDERREREAKRLLWEVLPTKSYGGAIMGRASLRQRRAARAHQVKYLMCPRSSALSEAAGAADRLCEPRGLVEDPHGRARTVRLGIAIGAARIGKMPMFTRS